MDAEESDSADAADGRQLDSRDRADSSDMETTDGVARDSGRTDSQIDTGADGSARDTGDTDTSTPDAGTSTVASVQYFNSFDGVEGLAIEKGPSGAMYVAQRPARSPSTWWTMPGRSS